MYYIEMEIRSLALEVTGVRVALLPQQRGRVLLGLLPPHHPPERHGLYGRYERNHELSSVRACRGVDVRDGLGGRPVS